MQLEVTAMNAFSPDLARHWLAGRGVCAEERTSGKAVEDDLSPAQEAALEELAERVNAARSVY